MNAGWGDYGAWGRTVQEDCARSSDKASGVRGRGLFGTGFLPWHSQEYWADRADYDCDAADRAIELLETQQNIIDGELRPKGGGKGNNSTDPMLIGGLGLLGLLGAGAVVFFLTRDDGRRR